MKTTGSALQREIGQRKPFRSPAHEASLGILRTADAVRRVAAGVIEPAGITLQQYNVLRILRGAGKAGVQTLEVGERMLERSPGVTRLVDRLESAGLVERERSAEDRRRVLCRITPAGLSVLAGLDAAVDDADRRAVAALGVADQKRLIRLLDRVRGGLE